MRLFFTFLITAFLLSMNYGLCLSNSSQQDITYLIAWLFPLVLGSIFPCILLNIGKIQIHDMQNYGWFYFLILVLTMLCIPQHATSGMFGGLVIPISCIFFIEFYVAYGLAIKIIKSTDISEEDKTCNRVVRKEHDKCEKI